LKKPTFIIVTFVTLVCNTCYAYSPISSAHPLYPMTWILVNVRSENIIRIGIQDFVPEHAMPSASGQGSAFLNKKKVKVLLARYSIINYIYKTVTNKINKRIQICKPSTIQRKYTGTKSPLFKGQNPRPIPYS
jgi:hypothetical protein